MAGTTPKVAIPYPTGTDKVVDGDNAMQALAERVDTLLAATDTSTGQLYSAGVQSQSEGPKGWRLGKLVIWHFAFVCTPSGFAADAVLLAQPAGWRPDFKVRFTLNTVGGSIPAVILADGTGNVSCSVAVAAGAFYSGTAVYVIP